MQVGYKNRDFRPISHFILEMIQDKAMGGAIGGGQGGHGPSNNLVGGAILYLPPPNILHWNLKF